MRIPVVLSRHKTYFETDDSPKVLVASPVPDAVVAVLDAHGFEVVVYEAGRSQWDSDIVHLLEEADMVVVPFPGDLLSTTILGLALYKGNRPIAYSVAPPPAFRRDVIFRRVQFVQGAEQLESHVVKWLAERKGNFRIRGLRALAQGYGEFKRQSLLINDEINRLSAMVKRGS